MSTPPVSALAAARDVLGWLVLHRATVRVVPRAPDDPPSLAVHPPGVLPPDLRALVAMPSVRQVIVRHLHAGARRFGAGDPALHSLTGTAAGFANLAWCLLPPDQRDHFHERAGIREFDGALSRSQAELLALFDVLDASAVIEAVATLSVAA